MTCKGIPFMYFKTIEILNFRNLTEVSIDTFNTINIFSGINGVGKTNILEAINYLSLTKSCFGYSDKQNINHQADFFLIKASVKNAVEHLELSCSYTQEGKRFKLNGKNYSKLADHIGLIPVVMTSPQDHKLIEDGGEEHRRFLNTALSQINKSYLESVMHYNLLLNNRNVYLRNNVRVDVHVIDAIDFKLLHHAKKIYEVRKNFIALLTVKLQEYYNQIAQSDKESVDILYHSHLASDNFEEEYRQQLQKDILLKHTSLGIHRDKLDFLLNETPIRRYGSQGQQKTYLLALRLAQSVVLSEHFHKKVILLFDDLFDKLDIHRSKNLFNIILTLPYSQIFITESNIDRIRQLHLDTMPDISLFQM